MSPEDSWKCISILPAHLHKSSPCSIFAIWRSCLENHAQRISLPQFGFCNLMDIVWGIYPPPDDVETIHDNSFMCLVTFRYLSNLDNFPQLSSSRFLTLVLKEATTAWMSLQTHMVSRSLTWNWWSNAGVDTDFSIWRSCQDAWSLITWQYLSQSSCDPPTNSHASYHSELLDSCHIS